MDNCVICRISEISETFTPLQTIFDVKMVTKKVTIFIFTSNTKTTMYNSKAFEFSDARVEDLPNIVAICNSTIASKMVTTDT